MGRRTRAVLVFTVAIVGGLAVGVLLRRAPTPVPPAAPALPAAPAPDAPAVAYRSFTEEIMAAPITVLVPEADGEAAAETVFGVFRDVDETMSEWKDGSPLSAVNRAAGREAIPVPADLRAVLRRGLEIGDLTGGAYDVTWAALWDLWDFKAEDPQVPADDALAARVALVDGRRVRIDDEAGTVLLPAAGMMLGLGGIAKGHALDRGAEALRGTGVESFLVAAGGQMMVGGERDGRPWRIGIRDPRGSAEDYFAYVDVTDASVSTSGDYERFFILDGVRYHHVLDPRTGRPARRLRSATVVSPDATLADALSTAFMVLGTREALALAERLDDVEAVLVDDEAGVHVTSGLADRLHVRHPPAP